MWPSGRALPICAAAFLHSDVCSFRPSFVECGPKASPKAPSHGVAGEELLKRKIPGIRPVNEYCDVVATFKSLEVAKKKVGVGRLITGCCARMICQKPRTHPSVVHLYCQRYDLRPNSTESCPFEGILKAVGDGQWELRTTPTGKHDASIKTTVGTKGWYSLEMLDSAEKQLTASAVAMPRSVYRTMLLATEDRPVDIDLTKIQNLKHNLGGGAAHREALGDLALETAKFCSVPTSVHKGFFCYRVVVRTKNDKPRVVLVATTLNLLRRFASTGNDGICAADGGFKHCIMGWPVTVHGTINPAGNVGATALILASDMTAATMTEACKGYRVAVEKATNQVISKGFAMADCGGNYRAALKEAYGAQNLMCWFHLVAAVREWFKKWCRLPQAETDRLWKHVVHQDLACMHEAWSVPDFEVRTKIVLEHWENCGIAGVTRHLDGNGKEDDLATYFRRQWVGIVPDWHTGYSKHPLPLPTTNNACESSVGKTRDEAGGVETGALKLVKFLLAQVEFFSKCLFDPTKTRDVQRDTWARAEQYRSLLRTEKVRREEHGGKVFYVAWGRESEDVADRRPINIMDAKRMLEMHAKLSSSTVCSYAELTEYRSSRITWRENGHTVCSCPAFANSLALKCFHSLALDMAAGRETLPDWMDDAPLMDAAIARVGRPPRVGDCYSKPEESEPARQNHSGDVEELLNAYMPGGEALKAPLPKDRVDRRRSVLDFPTAKARVVAKRPAAIDPQHLPAGRHPVNQVMKRPAAQACPEATPTKRPALASHAVLAVCRKRLRSKQEGEKMLAAHSLLSAAPLLTEDAFSRMLPRTPLLPPFTFFQMPPDGRCLYYTGVAAMHPSRYLAAGRSLDRYGYGLATDEEEAKWEDDQANLVKAKVSSLLLRDGKFAEATRLMRPGSDGYPGAEALPYLAEVIGGSIIVDPPVAFQSVMPQESFGEGQCLLHLHNDYMEISQNDDGTYAYAGAHYWVRQIWKKG
jgi:hypothetical protein